MIVCEVKQGGRIYVFKSKYLIKEGTWVLCDTRYGKHPGVVKNSFIVDEKSKLFKRYLELTGASEPLKEVIGIFVSVDELNEIRKRIGK